jgi:hypothetical protein
MVLEMMRTSENDLKRSSAIGPGEIQRVGAEAGYWPLIWGNLRLSHNIHCSECRYAAKRDLISGLWKAFSNTGDIHAELVITTVDFGKPHLLHNGTEGPGISFSYSDNRIWAALCDREHSCGIDVSRGCGFTGNYPYHRAFGKAEMQRAAFVTRGNMPEAAALLWSGKEAVVKAIGCGFHLIDPLALELVSWKGKQRGIGLSVELKAPVAERLYRGGTKKIRVQTDRIGGAWVSTVLINRERVYRVPRSARNASS